MNGELKRKINVGDVKLLYLLLLTFPFSIFPAFIIFGKGMRFEWLIGIIIIMVFMVGFLLRERAIKKNLPVIGVIFLNFFAVFSMVNLFNSSSFRMVDYLTQWMRLLFVSFLFLSIVSLKIDSYQVRKILRFWILVAFVLSLYAIYQVFARYFNLPFAYLPILNPSVAGDITRGGLFGNYIRPSSVFAEPSFFSQYILSPLWLAFMPFLIYTHKSHGFYFKNRLYEWTILLTLLSAFILTFSMGGYIVFFLTIIFMFIQRIFRKKLLILCVVFVLFFLLLNTIIYSVTDVNLFEMIYIRAKSHIYALFSPELSSGIKSPYAHNSVHNRVVRAMEGIKVWKTHPVFGAGLNNFQYYFSDKVAPMIHSGLLQILAELGAVGFLAFGCIFCSLIWGLKKRISLKKDRNLSLRILAIIFYCVIFSRLLYVLIAGNWLNIMVWIDLSFGALVLHIVKEGDRKLNMLSFS